MSNLVAHCRWIAIRSLVFTLVFIVGKPTRADAPPEVLRVRVPSDRASAYFPPGAAIRTLTPDRFETLVAGAKPETKSPNFIGPRRPIRVEHEARWESGMLAGRSRISLPSTVGSNLQRVIELEPWSPALLDSADRLDHIQVNAAGHLIVIQPADQPSRTVELRWNQAAQPSSQGQVFALHLPEADVATLTLDLPPGTIATAADALPGSRHDLPPDSDPNRSRCEFTGALGRFALQIHPPASTGSSSPLAWVGGTTRIDLNSSTANWVADWRLEINSGGAVTGQFDLDPGLELIDVAGPEVRSFRLIDNGVAPAGRSRVEVTFRTTESSAARILPLTIRGHAAVPLVGVWSIPSATSIGALGWLGGRTEVRLDPAREVVASVERSGRRVEAQPDETGTPAPWIFEATSRPGPIADLHLATPQSDASVKIDGTLRVGGFAPKVEVLATWTVGQGGFLAPSLDFPALWVVDQVVGGDGRANIPWHIELVEGGTSRVHLDGSAWPTELPGRSISVRLAATRLDPATPNADGALALPRVRPVTGSIRVAAERWVAVVEPGWEAVPSDGQGLVWDDAGPQPGAGTELIPAFKAEQRIAWRWVGDNFAGEAEAGLTYHRSEIRPRVDERLEAEISGGRLRLVWFWTFDGTNRPASLPYHLGLARTAAPRWRLVALAGGRVVEARPLNAEERAKLGWPKDGLAAEIATGSLPAGPITLRGEAEVAWSGSGPIPLVNFPESVLVRRSVVVRVADATRLRVDRVEGLSPVARGEVGDPSVTPASESSPYRTIIGEADPGLRAAGAWLGEARPCVLDLTTEGEPADLGPIGVITEAALTSRLAPGSATRHRLVLRVAPGSTRTLDLKLPEGATLDRVRSDGQPALVTTNGPALRVVLTQPDPKRLTSTTTVDYRTIANPLASRQIHPANLLPTTSLACLSFTWQVNAPERFDVRSESSDLVTTDLADLKMASGEEGTEADSTVKATMLADLDKMLKIAPPTETSLGQWLTKLDAGRWPILIDRQALLSVGLGPRSRVNVALTDSTRSPSAVGVFGSLGLAVEPIGAVLLVTTEADRWIGGGETKLSPAERTTLGSVLFEASIASSDLTDRYQAPSRWRGEPTPRAWLVSETPDRGLVAHGWRTHRFAATGWPTAAIALTLVDSRLPWSKLGLGVAAIALIILLAGAIRLAVRRGGSGFLILLAVGFALAGPASAQLDKTEPIIAVMPYDDLAQVELPPDRVLILESDHDRLIGHKSLTRSVPGSTNLVNLTHQLTRPEGARSVVVESRGTVEVGGSGLGSWTIPVGSSLDLTATVVGHPAPVQISADGRTATVDSIPAGRSSVVWRRLVPVMGDSTPSDPASESIRLPIPRAAFARVEVAASEGFGLVEIPGLVGARRPLANGFEGEIGPVDLLEARWGTASPSPSTSTRPDLNGVIRWDAGPVGDRIEARWTLTGSEPVGLLRIALEPGLAVIGQTIPGLVGITLDGTADRPEWVAHLDPPLRAGATGTLIFWRPRSAGATDPDRPIPRWNLVGGQWSGLVGCRVPAGWSGRLDGPSGTNPPGSADFDRVWKSSAAEGWKLVGVKRWSPGRAIMAEVVQEPPGLKSRDRVGVKIVAGVAEVSIDSTLIDPSRPVWEASAVLGGPIDLVRVEGVGLKSWTQVTPNRVHLVFDGMKPSHERSVHLEGSVTFVPVETDNHGSKVELPCPLWEEASVDPGTLTVQAPEGWTAQSGETPLIPDPANSTATTRTYAMGPLDRPTRLVGPSPTARVNVVVTSDLRLELDRAVWTAEMACAVAGGPVRELFWQLPTAWAESARLSLGDGHDGELAIEPESRGESTVWKITLTRPIWSRQTLKIEAVQPLTGGRTLDYPEVVPLSAPGRGEVERYDLTITNLAGSALTLVKPTGLTPLNHSRVRTDASAVPGGVVSRAFRVTGERWSLGLQIDSEVVAGSLRSGEADVERRLARVEQVDLCLTLDSAGRVGGRAECRVRPGGAFLAVRLAAGASLIGTMVEGKPVTPVSLTTDEAPRRWLIPLGDTGPRRVVIGWVEPGQTVSTDPTIERSISLPGWTEPAVPTSLDVASTCPAIDLVPTGGTWARLTPSAAALARFERLGADLIAATRRVDHDPTSVESLALLEDLVTLELDHRAADRQARVAGVGSVSVATWRTTRDRVRAAIVDAGLGSLLGEADQRVGLTPTEFDITGVAPPEEVSDPYRNRRIGANVLFQGTTGSDPATASTLVIRPRVP